MICDSHSCVRLKWRTGSSAGYAEPAVAVVNAKGSGTGGLWVCRIYWPVLRCHHVSLSATSGENQMKSSAAASAMMTGRSHGGATRGATDSRATGAGGATGAAGLAGRFAERGGMRKLDFTSTWDRVPGLSSADVIELIGTARPVQCG